MRRLALLALLAAPLFASELTVDARRIQRTDLLTITVTLEDEFASLDDVPIPTRNLVLMGEPSVSSEFTWTNGQVARRKTLQYRARPVAEGRARVGPVTLEAEGRSVTLPAVEIVVLPVRTAASNDAHGVLRELVASGRDLLFVVAEVDRQIVYVGEPVTITWFLYNATNVQQWQIVGVPKLADFWTEELPKSETTERLYVGDVLMQRMPIRRVTLFPLRSGNLRVDGLTVQAAVLRRGRRGPFAIFEGEVAETSFTSAPLVIAVNAIPPGPPVDAVGDLALACAPPVQRNGGPVVVAVTLSGAGNLRASTPPRFASKIAADVRIEGGDVTLPRDESSFSMTRRWRYLLFPSAAGTLEIPPLTMRVFAPSSATRKELRCFPTFVNALTVAPPEIAPDESAAPAPPRRWPWLVAALVIALLLLLPRVRRELALRREVRAVLRDAAPAEIRARMQQRVRIDPREASDRGDAWRALLSLLDAAERERDIAVGAEKEIERRVAEVLRSAGVVAG